MNEWLKRRAREPAGEFAKPFDRIPYARYKELEKSNVKIDKTMKIVPRDRVCSHDFRGRFGALTRRI